MNKSRIIQRIGFLQDNHEGSIADCKSCSTCTEIRELGRLLEINPKIENILAKGPDMKQEDVFYLKQKEIPNAVIANALEMNLEAFKHVYYKDWGNEKGRSGEMKNITVPLYKDLKAKGVKEREIAKMFYISYKLLLIWKKENLTKEEMKDLKLTKYNNAQLGEKPLKTENEASQAHVEVEYKKVIKELENKLQSNGVEYERSIKDLIEKLEIEQEAKKKMSAAHQMNLQQFIDEKELAYQKAESEHQQYLDTLEKLKKTDYELENAKQRLVEAENERDQYKLNFEESVRVLIPMKTLALEYLSS